MSAPYDQLLEAASSGRLKALTIWSTPAGWQCNATADGTGWTVVVDQDFGAAMTKLMGQFNALHGPSGLTTDKDIFS